MKEEVSKDKYSQMKFPALNNNSQRNCAYKCPIYLFTWYYEIQSAIIAYPHTKML
jgi:hypothetical protein